MSGIYVFGSSGHAKVVIDILKRNKTAIEAVVAIEKLDTFQELQVIQEQDFFAKKLGSRGIVAVGDNHQREKIVNNILKYIPNFEFINAIDPTADISSAIIGKGTVVMKNVSINVDTTIGEHCIINTNASIDHDNSIGNYCSIAPSSTLGGNVKIGDHSAICIGATLAHKIEVGENSVVGAGSVVVKNINSSKVAFGVPCREIRSREKGDNYLN